MRRLFVLVPLALALVIAAAFALRAAAPPSWFYSFAGVSGPNTVSRIAPAQDARLETFARGGPHRLAILITDERSEWLGLARALKAQGVPFTMTRDPARALRHRAIFVYPTISGRALAPATLRALAAHVRGGGGLLSYDLAGGGLHEVFGVAGEAKPSHARQELIWAGGGAPPEAARTRFSRAGSEAELGSYAYQPTTARADARFETGEAALTCRVAGGRACLIGVDIGALARRAMDGRAEPIARRYVNAYEPSLDILVGWVRDFYVAAEPMPWLIDTTPAGSEVAIVLSHDVDFTRSVRNAVAYADAMHARGVRGTFFVQAKYIRDYNDDVFLTRATLPDLKRLVDRGMEVGSHTVAHSYVFKSFALGSGEERYPSYRPFVKAREQARGATVFGELRVSKFLLEDLVGAEVRSFRPGELSYPFQLPEALEATGYAYSSSITANSTLTHLPFQLTVGRAGRALAGAYEFPVTIEDEEAPRLGDRLDAANALIEKIAARHGLAVILIHPDVTDHKLAFETGLIEAWRERAWFARLDQYGDWWRARDALEVDLVDAAPGWSLRVTGTAKVAPVTIILPKAASARGGGLALNDHKLTLAPDTRLGPLTVR